MITVKSIKKNQSIEISISDESVVKIKKRYNLQLKRYNDASTYMNKEDVSLEEKEKHLPALQKIISTLSFSIYILKEAGHEVSESDISNGFEVA